MNILLNTQYRVLRKFSDTNSETLTMAV